MKLPSGKEIVLKIPNIEELKKFSSSDIIEYIVNPLIKIGECKKCGNSLTINI